MKSAQRKLQAYLLSCSLLLGLLAGCGTLTPPDVGAVVVAPKVQLPPVPTIVRLTEPKSAGYFQQELHNYSGGSPVKPTK